MDEQLLRKSAKILPDRRPEKMRVRVENSGPPPRGSPFLLLHAPNQPWKSIFGAPDGIFTDDRTHLTGPRTLELRIGAAGGMDHSVGFC